MNVLLFSIASRSFKVLVFTAASLATSAFTAIAEPIDRDQIHVSDGDTIRVGGKLVRLMGFDTPETTFGQYRCDFELEWGKRAARRLAELLDEGPIDIEYGKHLDRYRRPLARLTVNGNDVAKTLISERLAVRYFGRGPKMDWCPHFRGRRDPLS